MTAFQASETDSGMEQKATIQSILPSRGNTRFSGAHPDPLPHNVAEQADLGGSSSPATLRGRVYSSSLASSPRSALAPQRRPSNKSRRGSGISQLATTRRPTKLSARRKPRNQTIPQSRSTGPALSLLPGTRKRLANCSSGRRSPANQNWRPWRITTLAASPQQRRTPRSAMIRPMSNRNTERRPFHSY